MRGITTKVIETETGVTRHQLARWVKQGLLSPPEITWAPKGRGRQGVWSPDVLGTIRQIVEKARDGVTVAEIVRLLRVQSGGDGADLKAVQDADRVFDQWRTPGSAGIVEAPRLSVVDVLTAVLTDHLDHELGAARDRCERLATRATRDAQVRAALNQRYRGQSPVFLFNLSVERVEVVTDFRLADIVGDRRSSTTPIGSWFVVLFDSILGELRKRLPSHVLPEMPVLRFWMPRLVDEIDANGGWRYEFEPADDGQFGVVLAYERAKRLPEWDPIDRPKPATRPIVRKVKRAAKPVPRRSRAKRAVNAKKRRTR